MKNKTKPNEVRVEYTNGDVVFYKSIKSAEKGITDKIGRIGVKSVLQMGPPECRVLCWKWAVKLIKTDMERITDG